VPISKVPLSKVDKTGLGEANNQTKKTGGHEGSDLGNVIIDYASLKSNVEDNLCQNTIGIASTVKCKCYHEHKWETNREKVNWEGEKQNLRANTDYALNVQLIMAMQEIGGGGTESNIVMLFLNLAQGSTMKTTTFHKIEDTLDFLIRKISLKSMLEALKKKYVFK